MSQIILSINLIIVTIKDVSSKSLFFLDLSRSVGILLYGPNGVGKTFVSQSIANDMNVPVIKINASIVKLV